ncbi:UvrD-helicase domain-containing protein [Synechococcus sp. Cruz-9H2]|uniref:UvrD-helicase domain-containing protein n=1 Tax=unclassified Synechococcus TaxID=2626047 RepID=UPI0020CF261D|nr:MULTISPECIES: UvrD-helicase domain-containing protein [unclassified Synechococcus]MCP9818381.1 UvrD-helicase domain-containing protein [Synechococcus sp. Cruz-9H2]MCP9842120.1 UvrD-helicase domain-containing protein [Synechococcus sp. Edmonson 11F2]MCP9854777.1 UvrD-helicase domain-containing protein [Synechococcus sp. Cruz-9C9]MCP9861528.1 UvrD-helicase domain-containing protein [Synechococcus sp. Cruz-7E5]MCP9869289.1 UvrD-helicase domain-containing protein [Synechococcus sp. Cruz-7B9]
MTISHHPPDGGWTLSEEQQAIVHSRSDSLRVLAFAGTGKTTTLRAYARERPQQRILYLAFNRTVAAEARESFPGNVTCSTIHALAYRAVGYRYRHQLRGSIRANQAAVALGLDQRNHKDLVLADRALKVLQHFLCSGCDDMAEFAWAVKDRQRYPRQAMQAAARLWELMVDPSAFCVPMLHDGYLKLYQLSRPRLRYDVILLDEAQDTNPVTLRVLSEQTCSRVFVGDPHQQIYQFRHATNAMAGAGHWDELALTGSFRFGADIAEAANHLLALKGETRQLRGLRSTPAPDTSAFIARGNAAIYKQALVLACQGKQTYWCGGIDGYRLQQLLDLYHLKRGEQSQIRDRFLAAFKGYGELCSYADEQDVRDLKAWCHLIDRHERWEGIPEEIAGIKRMVVSSLTPTVMALTTAHKSKGLEFGSVTLADDFHCHDLLHGVPIDLRTWEFGPEQAPALWDEQGYRGGVVLPEVELNLRYVALTRAQQSCSSKQWPAPLFDDLASYINDYPRFLLVDSHEVLKPKVAGGAPSGHERVDEPEMGSKTEVTLVKQSRAPEPALRSESASPVPVAEAAPRAGQTITLSWFQGAIDSSHVHVVASHYERRYPALAWHLLLLDLSALRVVTTDPADAVANMLGKQQLDSALPLVERFLLDVGLVLQQDPAVDLRASEGPKRECPVEKLVDAVECSQEGAVVGDAVEEPARHSMRKRLASLWMRSGQ